MTANGTKVEHRIERRRLPAVRHLEIKKSCEEVHARVVDPSAFALPEHQKRYQRGTLSFERILCDMSVHLGNDLGRKFCDLASLDDLVCVTCRCSCRHLN